MSGRPWLKMAQMTRPNENMSLRMQQEDCNWFSGAAATGDAGDIDGIKLN